MLKYPLYRTLYAVSIEKTGLSAMDKISRVIILTGSQKALCKGCFFCCTTFEPVRNMKLPVEGLCSPTAGKAILTGSHQLNQVVQRFLKPFVFGACVLLIGGGILVFGWNPKKLFSR